MQRFTYLFMIYFFTAQAVKRPPKIDIQPEHETIFFKPGETISLPCVASGSPNPKYSWKLNGQTFIPVGHNDSIEQIPDEGTIVFNSPGPKDEGIYQCFATNEYGVSASMKTVFKEAKMDWFMQEDSRTYTVHAGESLTIPCIPPRSYPQSEVTWLIKEPDGGWTALEFTKRVVMDREGRLRFANVKKSDEQDGRPYTCMVMNSFLRTSSMGPENVVQVQGDQELAKPAMTMWTSPSDMFFLKGETLKLGCIFSGNPTPDVYWEKLTGDKALPEDRTKTTHGLDLSISNLRLSDAGKYQCVGTNSRGPSNRPSTIINVKVESRPYWVTEPRDVIANEGDDAKFVCEADGIPKPKAAWYINGVLLTSSQDPRIKSDRFNVSNNNIMTLTNLSVEDRLNIQCNASNRHGYIWADVYLNIRDSVSVAAFKSLCFLVFILELTCVLSFY